MTEVWEGIDIPKNRDECFMRNKFLIRKGVPDVCRGYVNFLFLFTLILNKIILNQTDLESSSRLS